MATKNWLNKYGAVYDGEPFIEPEDKERLSEEWYRYLGSSPPEPDNKKTPKLNWLEKCIIYPLVIIILMYLFGLLMD
ncbi:MAG: hypothetical protein IKI67_00475 [Bacteroidales bacterium]|nr:hypothetical protein [Bacteroidales bacterium]